MERIQFENIGQLITLAPLAKEQRTTGIGREDLGILESAWMVVEEGTVVRYGSMTHCPYAEHTVDMGGALVLPGFVDAHTHPMFAGDRSQEFGQRLAGLTYSDIAKAGGGIRSSMRATRGATQEDLEALALSRLQQFLRYGTTTVEVKSGYGLSVDSELQQLRALQALKGKTPQHLVVTCMALHDIPPEFSSSDAYTAAMEKELLPRVAGEKLADFVDVFIDEGYFIPSTALSQFMERAKALGFCIRVHADEFTDAGGALAAAQWGAVSADHLQHASREGIEAMARARVTATLLPGTSLYTSIPYTDARPFLQAGCAVAVATDFNPGSCRISNLALLATIAGIHCHLSLPELLAGITYVPSVSLGLGEKKGALAVGFDADFLVYESLQTVDQWVASCGMELPSSVWIQGVQSI